MTSDEPPLQSQPSADVSRGQRQTDERLAKSLAWQEAIFEGSRDAIFISDADSRLIAVNRAACELTGYPRKALLQMRIPDLHDEEDLRAYRELHARILSGEELLSEAEIRRADGTKVPTEFSNRTIEISGACYMHTVARDVSDRKKREMELAASKERFSSAFNSSPHPMTITSYRDGRYIDANDAFLKATGFARDEVLGRTVEELGVWSSSDMDAIRQKLRNREPIRDVEVPLWTKAREQRLRLFSAEVITLDGLTCILAASTDITDRKRAERVLRESETRLKLLNSIGTAITTGTPPEQIIVQTLARLREHFPDVRVAYSTIDQQGLLTVTNSLPPEGMKSIEGCGADLAQAPEYLEALKAYRPVIVEDLEAADILKPFRETLAEGGTRALLDVPLHHSKDLIGLLCFDAPEPRRWTAHEINTLTEVAEHLAVAIGIGWAERHRRESEELLRSSEDRYRDLVEHINDFICTHDMEGRVLSANKGAADLLGFDPNELVGLNIRDFIAPGFVHLVDLYLEAIKRDGFAKGVMRIRTRRGQERIWEYHNTLRTEGVAHPIVRGLARDITERKRAEEALRASEERFSKAFNASPIPINIATLDEGRYIDANETFLQAVGISRDELIGRTSADLGFWEDLGERQRLVDLVRSTGTVRSFDTRFRTGSGEIRDARVSAEIVEIDGQECLLCIADDITATKDAERERIRLLALEREAREKAEAAHLEAEAARMEWQTTFDGMTDSVSIVDSEDRLIRANRAFYTRMNLSPGQCEGRPLSEVLHSPGRPLKLAECPICALRLRRERAATELPAGVVTDHPVSARIDPVVNEQGETIAVVQVVRDLSELYKAREEAERERLNLNAVVQQMSGALLLCDERSRIKIANDMAEEIFGFPVDQMRDDEAFALPRGRFSDQFGHTLDVADLPLQHALEQRRLVERHLWYMHPDGRRLLLSIAASPFFSEQNRLSGAIVLARDVTEQQREYERLQQADKLRALGQLASGVAHNFNNALAAIIGYTQLALTRAEDPTVERHLQVVERSAKDAARMVERIQRFARKPSRKENFIRIQLDEIVKDAVDITRLRWSNDADSLGIPYEVTVAIDAPDGLPVIGDPSELREVFVNIIMNSLDAMPLGGKLSIAGAVDGDFACLSFTDTGSGMTEETRRRVFEPFFTTKGVKGLGMGLSESFRITERHGGRFEIESEPYKGTTFRLGLPLAPRSAASLEPRSGRGSIGCKRILVIDDEEFVRQVLEFLLSEDGHDVLGASDAHEALELIDRRPFDLVVTDLAMPKVDGIAAAIEIKKRRPNTKVVLMSGYGEERARERAAETDAIDAVIAKPFNAAEVRGVLRSLFGTGRTRRTRASKKKD